MTKVTLNNTEYVCDPEKTLLDNVLTQGGTLPYSCMEGVCHACLMCATDGTPPPESQLGLPETLKAQHCFLTCQCKVTEDMTIAPLTEIQSQSFSAQLAERTQLSDHVFFISFVCPIGFDFHAGQFVNIINPATKQGRSYSISSTPNEGFLEFHIKHIPEGEISNWLCEQAKMGDEVHITGPFGECFYVPNNAPLILAGTGTGLAPLFGILKDAIDANHQGHIQLFHHAYSAKHLYYHRALNNIAKQHANIEYIPCVQTGEPPQYGATGDISDIVEQTIGDGYGKKAYLCGNPQSVEAMRKTLFMAGVAKQDIYADAFIAHK